MLSCVFFATAAAVRVTTTTTQPFIVGSLIDTERVRTAPLESCSNTDPCIDVSTLCIDTPGSMPKSGTCQHLAPLGGACSLLVDFGNEGASRQREPVHDNCEAGFCFVNAGQMGQCVPQSQASEPCDYQEPNMCASGLICSAAYLICVEVAAIGEQCSEASANLPTILCEQKLTCVSGVCAISTLTPCSNDGECGVDTGCHEGYCRIEAAKDGTCAPYSFFPELQQAWCPLSQICLPNYDEDGEFLDTESCYDDMCYGMCSKGTKCDVETNTCVRTGLQCGERPSQCCVPLKNVQTSGCEQEIQACVCKFDPGCCDTTLDTKVWGRKPGWDIQCVEEAIDTCFASCQIIDTDAPTAPTNSPTNSPIDNCANFPGDVEFCFFFPNVVGDCYNYCKDCFCYKDNCATPADCALCKDCEIVDYGDADQNDYFQAYCPKKLADYKKYGCFDQYFD